MSEIFPHQTGAAKPRSNSRFADPRDANFAVVGIGASAGGLEACTKFLDGLPADTGMAFILVQHLDPTHDSMLADLLGRHTSMTVQQATHGMQVVPGNFYIIPPGAYLSVNNGALRLSPPNARHGARMPFDFLLNSLAEEYGVRAICVVLSGTGADGCTGLKAVKERCGLIIAQEPEEAGFDGMPRNAIETGAVDLVLPVVKIPDAIVKYGRRMHLNRATSDALPEEEPHDLLPDIIELLRTKAGHDFTLYKTGTLQRRIERRMSIAAIDADDMDHYLDVLRRDRAELNLLAKDLLINVTSFFRDPKVFDLLAEKIVPEMIRKHPPGRSMRIWIAGCSTGEETYSLAMIFQEQITAAKSEIKLQVFASDVDPEVVAKAREGLYPELIAANVSPERLSRFFSKENNSYRISPELRRLVVFTVQDLLADPPFSRLDLVSCRNLLIYLRPEAQAKVISIFHFALGESGILLLGSAETAGHTDDRFKTISKSARLYRHVGRRRLGEFGFLANAGETVRLATRTLIGQPPNRQAVFSELCRRLVIESYAPAAILINRTYECLYSLGPTERYLSVAPGHPTHDLLAMARRGLRVKLRAAIQRAIQENTRITIPGGQIDHDGQDFSFGIEVQPVTSENEELLLICFVDEPKPELKSVVAPQDAPRVAELEHELESMRVELRSAIRNLEISGEVQLAINEEALSVNEEYQSTNEELLTSKEELQSLNEELTALNSQLQETLERQRTTANDLQNILYSTDVATLFLDAKLKIRFFTPAIRSLFKVIPGDIGRPLADLNSMAADDTLLADAETMMKTQVPQEREIETQQGIWYQRRIMPYRAQDNRVEGVVITFIDVTERKQAAKLLETAKQEADSANMAKSRFLAAASHDLRQPLQTLTLLQGLLMKTKLEESAEKLVALLDPTLSAMSGMLNTLLDINQIDAGVVSAEIFPFSLGNLLERLKTEFTYHAHSKGLTFHVVSCGLTIQSDPRLLEQMIRNLLINALKYTKKGKVLLGCRRHKDMLSIEVWDTGIGMPDGALQAIFDEYHQLDNAARERSRGLGLGLSIVKRLSILLGLQVKVRSTLGRGSVFSIEVPLPSGQSVLQIEHHPRPDEDGIDEDARVTGAILVIEDDPEVRELLELFLKQEGHSTVTAYDGPRGAGLVADGGIRPDLILADYNLPNGMDGLQVTGLLRERQHDDIPVVMLTGDISTATLHKIADRGATHLTKPVKLNELTEVIQTLLSQSHQSAPVKVTSDTTPVIFIVDDNAAVRDSIRKVLEDDGRSVETYATAEAFLKAYGPGREGCLLIDAYLPGISGLELLQRLSDLGQKLPSIVITGHSDVPMVVRAMKAGALDFIEKPIDRKALLSSIGRALELTRDSTKVAAWRKDAAGHLAGLTTRQRHIMDLVLAGHPSKNIAADLGLSQRTVETHRATIMKKTGCKSLPELARMALAAQSGGASKA